MDDIELLVKLNAHKESIIALLTMVQDLMDRMERLEHAVFQILLNNGMMD